MSGKIWPVVTKQVVDNPKKQRNKPVIYTGSLKVNAVVHTPHLSLVTFRDVITLLKESSLFTLDSA